MKKTILITAIALTAVLGISRSASASTSAPTVSTQINDISNINEIEVHGNVQVYLTNDNQDNVKVYNNYYADNALVQERNGVLRISSYASEKLVVWVKVNNLSKLSVFDDAVVSSFGKFSALDLDVNLHDNALAKLDIDAFNASITADQHAKTDLSGFVQNATLKYAPSNYVNVGNLTVANLTKTVELFRRECDFASL